MPNNSGLTLKKEKMPTSKSYQDYLIDSLKDPQEAAAYLDAVLEDCTHDELLLALRNVVQARQAAENSSQVPLNRDIIQKIFAADTNLELSVLLKLLGELGFKLSVTSIQTAA
jgi:DNA-binding phage protein